MNDDPVSTPQTLRVLVVDDDRDSADSLAIWLDLLGHHVRTAYSGRSALREYSDFRPDVAFIDLAMPGITGYALVQRMSQHAGPFPPMFVAVTGFADEAHRTTAFRCGFQHFFSKPVAPTDLEQFLAGLPRRAPLLKLYVAGLGGRATQAVANLRRLCDEDPLKKARVELIDVQARPDRAEQDRIVQTPCLIYESGEKSLRVIGDLGDGQHVLGGLGMRGIAPAESPRDRSGKRVPRRRRAPYRVGSKPARPAHDSSCALALR